MIIETRQILFDYDEARQNISFKTEAGLEDYMALKSDVRVVIERMNNDEYSPKFGDASPEGEIISNFSKTYFDTATDPLGATMYVNENVNAITGWVKVV